MNRQETDPCWSLTVQSCQNSAPFASMNPLGWWDIFPSSNIQHQRQIQTWNRQRKRKRGKPTDLEVKQTNHTWRIWKSPSRKEDDGWWWSTPTRRPKHPTNQPTSGLLLLSLLHLGIFKQFSMTFFFITRMFENLWRKVLIPSKQQRDPVVVFSDPWTSLE